MEPKVPAHSAEAFHAMLAPTLPRAGPAGDVAATLARVEAALDHTALSFLHVLQPRLPAPLPPETAPEPAAPKPAAREPAAQEPREKEPVAEEPAAPPPATPEALAPAPKRDAPAEAKEDELAAPRKGAEPGREGAAPEAAKADEGTPEDATPAEPEAEAVEGEADAASMEALAPLPAEAGAAGAAPPPEGVDGEAGDADVGADDAAGAAAADGAGAVETKLDGAAAPATGGAAAPGTPGAGPVDDPAAMVGAWTGRVQAAAAAMPAPRMPDAPSVAAPIVHAGGAAAARHAGKAEGAADAAEKVLDAKPLAELTDLPPIEGNDPELEAAMDKVRSVPVHAFQDQSLPKLEPTPHGVLPTVGGQPIDTTQPPPPPAPAPVGPAPPPKTPVAAVNKEIATLPSPAPVSGQGQTITGSERPPANVVTAPHRADIAAVLARVTTEAASAGGKVVHDARAKAYPGADLNGSDGFKDLGDDLVDGETAWFGEEMGRVAEAAKVGKKALDDAVADRRKQLAGDKGEDDAEVGKAAGDQTAAITRNAAAAKATIKAVREDWLAHWESVGNAAKGDVDPKAVWDQQDKVVDLLRKSADDHLVAWAGMETERKNKLDTALRDQLAAYQAAALADQKAHADAKPAEGKDAKADDANAAEVTDAELKMWLFDRDKALRGAVGTLKDEVHVAVDGWQTVMRTARDQAIGLVRVWADTKIGRQRSFFGVEDDQLAEELLTKQTETEAFAAAESDATASAVAQDLELIEALKKKRYEDLDRAEKEHLDRQDRDQQELLNAYFKGPDKGDTVLYLAKMMELRLERQRLPGAIQQIKAKVLAADNVQHWTDLEVIGKSQSSSFTSARAVADQLWQAFEYTWGTDEDKAYRAVAGLTVEQGKAVRGAYWEFHGQQDHGQDLDTRLADEMSAEEYDRVKFGLDGKHTEADAAALRDAVEGLGTNEQLINDTLRNKSAEERKAIAAAYKSRYHEDLTVRLDDELSGDEKAVTYALLEGNAEKADAIEVKAAKESFWGPDQDKIEKVYTRVRDEATSAGDASGWTSKEIDAEIARRSGKMAVEYKRYTQRDMLPDLEQAFSPPSRDGESPAEREYRDQYWKGRRDLVLGMAKGDLTRADAGKIQIERTGVYAKDDTINAVLGLQYDRAYERERRDALVTYAKLHQGQSPNKEDMAKLEADASARAEVAGKKQMAALGSYFEKNYTLGKESFSDTIKDLTQGTGEDKAVALMDQGGRLKDWQVLEFATAGAGTDDDTLKKLFKSKKTKAEFDQLEKDWLANTKQQNWTWGGRKRFNSLDELIEDETSGRLKNDLHLDYKFGAEPEDPKLAVAKAREQLGFEKISGGIEYVQGPDGELQEVKSHEYKVLEKSLARLETQQKDYELAQKLPEDDPKRAWATLRWQAEREGFSSAVETHRAMVDQRTELVAQVASMVTAIVVGALITVFTGGAGTPAAVALIAGVSSLFGAAAGIITKASMKGAAYGADELGTDIVIGLVDTVVSAATAGFGDKILKGAKGAAQLGEKGLLATLGRMAEGNLAQRAAAHALAHGAEGALQSLPTALVGTMMNEQTWKEGNPFLNILTGVGTGVGMAAVMSGGMGALGTLRKGAHASAPHEAPHVEPPAKLAETHGAPHPTSAEARYFEAHPGRTKAEFRHELDGALLKAAEHDPAVAEKLQSRLRDQVTDLLPPHHKTALERSKVEMWDARRFEEHTGSKTGQAVVIIKDGDTTVIVKQGADPSALAEEGFHLVQALDPKTKAKVARLNEETMARWSTMDPRERLQLYKEKLDLEIDAQKQVIGALEARGREAGIGPELAERMAAAKGTLENLEKRFGEVGHIGPLKRTLMGWGVLREPEWLDQPARLFSKKDLGGPLPSTLGGLREELDALGRETRPSVQQRDRLALLQAELEGRYHVQSGETEPRVFRQDPGEALADYRDRLRGMAGEIEERATRPGGDLDLHEGYQKKLGEVDARTQQLRAAEERLASAKKEFQDASREYHRLHEARRKAGLGEAFTTPEEASARRLSSQMEAKLKLAKAEVTGLGRVDAPGWKEHTYGDLGNPHKSICFAPGTLVKTPGGDRPIDALHEGDLVFAFDLDLRTVEARPVVRVHTHWAERMVETRVAGEIITSTRQHPFWLEERRTWSPAHALGSGDLLRGLAGPVEVEHVTSAEGDSPTVNLEVDGLHNFFVGRAGVLVHNGETEVFDASAFAKPDLYPSKFYRIIRTQRDGQRLVVYVGKTWQDTIEKRFEQHMKTKGWTSPPYETVAIDCPIKREMTAFETAVWEKHYIELYKRQNEAAGVVFEINGKERNLLNDPKADPINADSYKENRDLPFNRPCE
jgi:hypothetical protein